MMFPGMPMMSDAMGAMGAMGWWMAAYTLSGIALVGILAYVLVRDRRRTSGDDARRILDTRLASGEIDAQEYRDRRALLG